MGSENGWRPRLVACDVDGTLVDHDGRLPTAVGEAIDLVASKQTDDGRWRLDTQYPGRMPVETDEGEGRPSRWNTLRVLRVLNWWGAAA